MLVPLERHNRILNTGNFLLLSIRARFLAISVTITIIALSLFTHVIYDKAIGYKHQLEKNSFRIMADQLLSSHDVKNPMHYFNEILRTHINSKNQAAKVFAIFDNNLLLSTFYKDLDKPNYLPEKLISTIQKQDTNNEGLYNADGRILFWLKRTLPGQSQNRLSFLAIYPLSTSAISETLNFFGTPLFISGFLLLWCMVWASIILSSLVTKLQNQKQTLSDQAADIENARDEALKATEAKSRFLANMSHEIRTPLTSIIGFAESCLDANQSMKERFEATSTIIRSGHHLLHIINEILDISKIEAGKLEIEITQVNLADLLQEVNQFIKVLAQEKGLNFTIEHTFPLPDKIFTDQLRLKQILLNLCSNAVKFTEKGHALLNVSYNAQSHILQFEVADTGIGMSDEQITKIFSPFQQADSSITREYGGTGLGLTLSKELIERLNGKLEVKSILNKGSRFITYLEVKNVDENDFIYEINYDEVKTEGLHSLHSLPSVSGQILVAEDNPDIQSLIKMMIKKSGATIEIADNGKIAIQKAIESDFDLIFLDIQMPIMGGFEALKQLRSNGYIKPVFAMTANTMQKDRDQCYSAGFDGFISKPIDKNDLYSVIIDYLKSAEENSNTRGFITSTIVKEEPQIIELVDAFLERIPEIMAEINTAIDEKNWEELGGQIHQMKGIGGAFGYDILTKISAKIEFLLTTKDYEQIQLLVDDLNNMCKQAIAGKEENYKLISQ